MGDKFEISQEFPGATEGVGDETDKKEVLEEPTEEFDETLDGENTDESGEESESSVNFTDLVRPIVLSGKNFNKIFGIGYNKTGTTTIEKILTSYGYRMPNQQEQEMRLTLQCYNTDYAEFKNFVSGYDAFQDLPFSDGMTYVVADALFPNSKFILTERDPDIWFNSMLSFHKKMFEIEDFSAISEDFVMNNFDYLYRGYSHAHQKRFLTTYDGTSRNVLWDKLYDRDFYTSRYKERNQEIKRYFADAPQKLLVLDVTKEETTEKICQFLNIPEMFVMPMPHENKT